MNWLFVRKLRGFVMLAGGASLLLNLALLMPAIYMLQVFDRVFTSRSVETLVMLSALTALLLILGYFLDKVRARALAWAGRALDRELSPRALANALHAAAADASKPDTNALRDIGQLRALLSGSGILALFDAPWLPLYLGVIALMHPILGLVAMLGALTLVALGWLTFRLTHEHAQRALAQARATSQHAEALTRNAEVIVGMGMTAAAVEGWREQQSNALDTYERLGTVSATIGAAARISRQALQVIALGVGAWLVIDTQASPGIMIAATVLLGRALQPAEHLISGWRVLSDARDAWQRLNRRPALADAQRLSLPVPAGRLDIERLTFKPGPMRPAIVKGIGFSLEAGESLGVIGPSASGKTTLIRLLLGVCTPSHGVVRLDGADIAQWNRDELGQHIGYLPQDVELFAGTVAENIARLGKVDSTRVVKAAQLARVHEMILRLPDGYETQIGAAGAVLSGGQRQRIALARALYGEPRLVVLDEPNANLDAEGESALAAVLKDLKRMAITVIMVGHRSSLMTQLDKLAVMKEGSLEAFGASDKVLPRLRVVSRPPPAHCLIYATTNRDR